MGADALATNGLRLAVAYMKGYVDFLAHNINEKIYGSPSGVWSILVPHIKVIME